MKRYGIVGTGGFGREVIPIAQRMLRSHPNLGDFELVFIDDNPTDRSHCNGYRLLNTTEFFDNTCSDLYFNIAIAHSETRQRIAEKMQALGAKPFRIQASEAVELDNNQIGDGSIFCPFTMVTSNAKIGHFFHANIYSYVAHDCIIGDYVTFAPGVHCNGNIIIEDHAYIGTGAVIRQGSAEKPIIIGRGAVVGMGAVVTKSVPALETVVGNPAAPLKAKARTETQ